jgi:hypothetical protein
VHEDVARLAREKVHGKLHLSKIDINFEWILIISARCVTCVTCATSRVSRMHSDCPSVGPVANNFPHANPWLSLSSTRSLMSDLDRWIRVRNLMFAHFNQILDTIEFFPRKSIKLGQFVNNSRLTSSQKRWFLLKEEIFGFVELERRVRLMLWRWTCYEYSNAVVKVNKFPEMHIDSGRSAWFSSFYWAVRGAKNYPLLFSILSSFRNYSKISHTNKSFRDFDCIFILIVDENSDNWINLFIFWRRVSKLKNIHQIWRVTNMREFNSR